MLDGEWKLFECLDVLSTGVVIVMLMVMVMDCVDGRMERGFYTWHF